MRKFLFLAMMLTAFGSQAFASTDSYNVIRIDKAVVHFDVNQDHKPYIQIGNRTYWLKVTAQSRLLKALGIDGQKLSRTFDDFVGNHRFHNQNASTPFEFVGFTDGRYVVVVKMNNASQPREAVPNN